MSWQKLEYNIQIGLHIKKGDEMNKSKDELQGDIEEIRFNYLTKKKNEIWSNEHF